MKTAFITALAALLATQALHAQTTDDYVRVGMKNGAIVNIAIDDIERIDHLHLEAPESLTLADVEPTALEERCADYDIASVRHLTITGFLTPVDIEWLAPYCADVETLTLDGATLVGGNLADEAFFDAETGKGLPYVSALSLPAGTQSVGSGAFRQAYSLASLALGADIRYIGSEAFARCYALRSVTIDAAEPPMVEDDAFAGIPQGAVLTVPADAAEAYAATAWAQMFVIKESTEQSAEAGE